MIENLTTIATLILGLSIATERLVEIVKGIIEKINLWFRGKETGFLSTKLEGAEESVRRTYHHVLAVLCGIFTAWLAMPVVPNGVLPESYGFGEIMAFGLLASGGSGMWNGMLGFLNKAKTSGKPEGEEN